MRELKSSCIALKPVHFRYDTRFLFHKDFIKN